MSNTILERHDGAVAFITLNRPERHNAFDDTLILELTAAFTRAGNDPGVRAVVLDATGKSFSAGADLEWMGRMAGYSAEENRHDALALAELMRRVNTCPKPVVAVVQGAAFGGGVGLAAACDIAVAADTASFCLSEVRLGLIPAVISPYVVAAMGERACRRYFHTAERFSAAEARRLGLVHEVVAADALEATRDRLLASILDGGPQAQLAVKALIATVARPDPGLNVAAWTAGRIAEVRASPEGRDGVEAFLGKRKPGWLQDRSPGSGRE
jgi:methylglutaconyl-CoA hydratase